MLCGLILDGSSLGLIGNASGRALWQRSELDPRRFR